MATITTRAAKGSALTFTEVDNNFTGLNADGVTNAASIASLQTDKFDKAGGTITGATTVNATLTLGGKSVTSTENNTQSGTAVSLTVPGAEIVRLTNAALVSVSGILAGSSGQKVVLVNRTNTTVEVENESSSALASSQIFTGTGGSLLLQSNASISLVYDYTTSRWNIVGGSGAGTGSGIINYIENPDASIGTTGYTTYDDGAAAPVDGSGGSPKAGLFVRSTTTPLRGSGDFNIVKTGATSYQGNGVAYDFTIDNADLAKVLTVTFDYEVVSGTYVDGDFTVYLIQDPTGTPVVIQPAGYKILAGTAGTKLKQIATFQTDFSVKNYRLCFHCATTSALDYTLALDNIVCGPQVVQYGAPVTDWVTWTPTGSWTTNTTYTGQYRRVGDSLEANIKITLSGAPNSATLTINIPSGLTIDTTKLADTSSPNPIVGIARLRDATGSGSIDGSFGYNTPTALSILNLISGSHAETSTNQTTPMVWASGDTVNGFFRVPILGWSSTVQMSNDTDTRVVAASASSSSLSAYSTTAPINFSTVNFDSHSAITAGASWKYTAPVSGYYTVIISGISSSTASGAACVLYKNGVSSGISILDFASSATYKLSGSVTISLNAGDYIDIRPSLSISITPGTISINRLSGPSAIAANEDVIVSCIDTSGTSIGTTDTDVGRTLVPFASEEIDTHGAFSSGVFTAPISGKYEILARYVSIGTTAANMAIHIYKNGASLARGYTYSAGATINHNPSIFKAISLVAGDTIEIRGRASTVTALDNGTNPCGNLLSIKRIGN
jgi:hypothetical protein